MPHYQLRLYREKGSDKKIRHVAQQVDIEADNDAEAVAKVAGTGIPEWDDSDYAILWSSDGRDVKHWTPHA